MYIPPSKKWKGLTVYCYKCNTNVSEICKQTGKSIQRCPFGIRHKFKVYVHIPGSENSRRTKTLETQDINEAIKQAIEFEKEVKEGSKTSSMIAEKSIRVDTNGVRKNAPHILIHALGRYVGWLHNENVPTHLQNQLSSDYVKDIERKLPLFIKCLKENGINPSTFRVDQIDDTTVGYFHKYLDEKTDYSPRTFNKIIDYWAAFLNWFSEEHYPVRKWFNRGKRQPDETDPGSMTQEIYQSLLEKITPANGIAEYHTGVKPERNFYRPYLKDAFRLALETGRRREELINIKYCDIVEEKDGSGYIKVEDLKVNHIQKRTTEKNKKYNYVPLTDELREHLNELGYEKLKGTNNYVIAPEIKDKRNKVMADLLSRSFTHYYKQLNAEGALTFKSFRKTYLTNLAIHMQGSEIASKVIGHAHQGTTGKYYLDPRAIAKALRGFKVFPGISDREEELEQVRNKPSKNKEVER